MLKHSDIEKVFGALSDATRRAMVESLSRGPASVSELAEPLDITLAAVLQHLQVLESCGLVKTEKVGRVRACRLELGGLRVAEQWLSERRRSVERKLDRLEALLDEELAAPTPKKRKKP